MILLTLWLCSTILVLLSAAHVLPISIQIAMLPIVCTAILICAQQMYHDPCFRVPFWATPTRLRSLSEIEDPPPVPVYHYARESIIAGLFFWTVVLWSVSYTVSACIVSGFCLLASLGAIGSSISCTPSSSSSSMTNGSSSSTDV